MFLMSVTENVTGRPIFRLRGGQGKLALVIALLASLLSLQPAQAASFDFPSASSVPPGTVMMAVNEPNTFDAWSQWSAHDRQNFIDGNSFICPNGADEDKCDPSKRNVRAVSILSACKSEADQNCVESLSIASSGSNAVAGTFVRGVDGIDYSAPDQGAIPTGEISLWKVPGVNHMGASDNYSVLARISQEFDSRIGKFLAKGLSVNVSPYSAQAGGEVPVHVEQTFANGTTKVTTRHRAECIWADAQGCGILEDFATDVRVELSIRMSDDLIGWFRGRLENPLVELEKYSTESNRLVISAEPVKVPRLLFNGTEENTTERIRELLSKRGGKGFNPDQPLFAGRQSKDFFSNEGDQLFEMIQAMRESANDTAAGESTLWNFNTIENFGNTQCFKEADGVVGFVTTNASAYRGDPPKFENGQLGYKVAGLHFSPDGTTINRGTYDLVMRSDVARCLYGFSNAPVSAQVQVINEDGEEVVATTVVSERDGWLKLAAYGFTFSEKEIQVKITQPQIRTLSDHPGRATALTTKQKAEIRAVLAKGKGNTKFICTGIRLEGQSASMNRAVRLRAKLACEYAKSLDPKLSTFYQSKITKARSYNGRVLVVSK